MDQGDISSILNAVVELLKRREVSKAEAKLTSVREQIHQSMLASRREAVDEINMDVVALKIQVEEIDLLVKQIEKSVSANADSLQRIVISVRDDLAEMISEKRRQSRKRRDQ